MRPTLSHACAPADVDGLRAVAAEAAGEREEKDAAFTWPSSVAVVA